MTWRGKALLFESVVMDKMEDGVAWCLRISNGTGPPLFPRSTVYQNFGFEFGAIHPAPDSEIPNIRYKLYADAMPYKEGSIEIEDIFQKQNT